MTTTFYVTILVLSIFRYVYSPISPVAKCQSSTIRMLQLLVTWTLNSVQDGGLIAYLVIVIPRLDNVIDISDESKMGTRFIDIAKSFIDINKCVDLWISIDQ